MDDFTCTPPKMMVSIFLFIPSYHKWFKINIIDKDQQKLNETLLLKCITGTGLNTFFRHNHNFVYFRDIRKEFVYYIEKGKK